MNCDRFEKTIELLSRGAAGTAARAAAEAHLRTCPRCARSYGPDGPDELEAPEPPDLTGAILEITSGPGCPAAARVLCDTFDEEVEAARTRLVDLHCSTCTECRGLAGAMRIMRQVLPEMAVPDPGKEFTAAVVAATRGLRVRVPRRWTSLGRLWGSLVRRPLFAWEAAYAGTLLFALLFLNPLLPLGAFSLHAFEAVHESAAGNMAPAEAAARDVARALAGRSAAVTETLGTWSGRACTFLHGTFDHIRGRLLPGRVSSHRTFLQPARLPGCETPIRNSCADKRGDHV